MDCYALARYERGGVLNMKIFFITVLSVFLIFIGAAIAGFLMPASFSVERSTVMEAYSDDVFPYLGNLENYKDWSALNHKLGNTALITGGADDGTGQSQAWKNGPKGYEFGSREIVQSQSGEFVQINLNIAGQDSLMTHAMTANTDGTVTVLSLHEIPQPGFPFVGRLRRYLVKSSYEAEMDEALERLKTQVEASVTRESQG
jgi:hypothetical protein